MIGVFDSGVGGLAVLSQVRKLLPSADLIYLADRERAPYGTQSIETVREMSHEIARWLIGRGATCLVIACNTASAAALKSLRKAHPSIPIVGMEPAVKPAARTTRSGTVAVFATAATFQGELFASVIDRFAAEVSVLTRACPEWVELVESGMLVGPEATRAVRAATREAVEKGADQIVLACTHFSFLAPLIEEVTGLQVIDPAPAVAMQTTRVAPDPVGRGQLTLAASGDLAEFRRLASEIAGISANVIPFGT